MRSLFLPLLALLAGCSPLQAFNSLVPKDAGVVRVASDQQFAAFPRGRLDIYAPAGRSGPLPVIVFFYGGSWTGGSKDGYAFVGRALAARGFVVAIPDYRLVPEVRFPAFVEDGAAAVRWVRAHAADYGGDPDRIVLAGHSAGAYNAAMLSVDPRWLGTDRAAVRGLIGIAGPYDFLPLDMDITRNAFGQAPDLAATQPVTFAGAGDPPALLLTGARDTLVGPKNAVALAAALRSGGVSVETRVYPILGHVGMVTAFARPLRGRGSVLADTAAFAEKVTLD